MQNPADTKLNVPYAEKDQAKALGARWDSERRTWYVPAGIPPSTFAKWLPKPPEPSKPTYPTLDPFAEDRTKAFETGRVVFRVPRYMGRYLPPAGKTTYHKIEGIAERLAITIGTHTGWRIRFPDAEPAIFYDKDHGDSSEASYAAAKASYLIEFEARWAKVAPYLSPEALKAGRTTEVVRRPNAKLTDEIVTVQCVNDRFAVSRSKPMGEASKIPPGGIESAAAALEAEVDAAVLDMATAEWSAHSKRFSVDKAVEAIKRHKVAAATGSLKRAPPTNYLQRRR